MLYFLSNQIVQIFEYKNNQEMFIIQIIFHFILFFFFLVPMIIDFAKLYTFVNYIIFLIS